MMDQAEERISFVDVGTLEEIPRLGARSIKAPGGDIAIFRTADDSLFALRDHCPHRGGPLSQGIVHGEFVTCPLHNWIISLASGAATGLDQGCTPRFDVKIENGRILLAKPSPVAPLRMTGEAA